VRASIVRLLRFVSIGVCLIVVASFVTFAIEQTKTASGHQQEQLATPAEAAATAAAGGKPASHEGSVHKALDEASAELTSPFAGVVSGSSEWATRGVKLLLALIVYGFGLGYLARVLRVRV
jgi:predicted PurR-regulated permease PerM